MCTVTATAATAATAAEHLMMQLFPSSSPQYKLNSFFILSILVHFTFSLISLLSPLSGSIDHVSIRQLQLMLLKFALILGVNFVENVTFDEMCPKSFTASLSTEEAATANKNHQCTCNGSMTSMSQQLNSKANCDECCLNCSSDDVDGNVLSNVCNVGNKRRHTGNITVNGAFTKVIDTTSESTTTRNDVHQLLADAKSEHLLTPPSSSSSMDDEEYDDANDDDDDDDDESEKSRQDVNECMTSRSRRTHSSVQSTTETSRNNGEAVLSEESSKLKCTSSLNGKNVASSCSCCCHLHSSSMNNANDDDGRLNTGAYAHFSIASSNPATASDYVNYDNIVKKLHEIHFDVVLGADGRRATLSDYFPRKEFRGRLAIAITANFVNTHTLEEARIPEISGISFIYNQQLFK